MNVLSILGAALSAWSAARLWAAGAARGWPVAAGEVLEATVRERQVRRGLSYVPRVRYRYTVAGRAFTGGRRAFRVVTPAYVVPSAAYAELAGLTPGDRVAVYYHPWVPRLAVLRPGYVGADVVAAACAVALLGAGLFFEAGARAG